MGLKGTLDDFNFDMSRYHGKFKESPSMDVTFSYRHFSAYQRDNGLLLSIYVRVLFQQVP